MHTAIGFRVDAAAELDGLPASAHQDSVQEAWEHSARMEHGLLHGGFVT